MSNTVNRLLRAADVVEPCAVIATCGRLHGHAGHHGGWRPLPDKPVKPTERSPR